jgi:hypothetical protein
MIMWGYATPPQRPTDLSATSPLPQSLSLPTSGSTYDGVWRNFDALAVFASLNNNILYSEVGRVNSEEEILSATPLQ